MGFSVLSEHVRIEAGEEKRIEAAVEALKADPHAPREITVKLVLNVHREYPKHVRIGTDENGEPILGIVNSAEEEEDCASWFATGIASADAAPDPVEPIVSDSPTIQ